MTMEATKQELIKSEVFENAVSEGAAYKKEIMTTYKRQNKDNFKRFQEVMFESDPEIKKILETKKKKRTDDDNAHLKAFKSTVSQMYKQATELIVPEKAEEGKKTKLEKIVDKIIPVVSLLQFIDQDILNAEFKKRNASVNVASLSAMFSGLAAEGKKDVLKDIFETAKNVKMKVTSDSERITNEVYTTKVPVELQFDKDTNNSGLKASDFQKIVDAKTKLLIAQTEDDKAKVDEAIQHIATEKQFEAARAELVRDSLASMSQE